MSVFMYVNYSHSFWDVDHKFCTPPFLSKKLLNEMIFEQIFWSDNYIIYI